MDDFDIFKQQLEENAVKIDSVNILFLDLSSTCTGYCTVNVDFRTKIARFLNAGALWFNKDMNNQDKYHYLFGLITGYFNIVSKIDYCFAEAYMLNPKRTMGCHVGPELHGVLQVALAEIGVKYSTIPVQTWRKYLGIKKDNTGDFKQPTADKVKEYLNIPIEIESNVTKTSRKLPYDVTDAIGMAIGQLKKYNFTNLDFSKIKIQEEIGLI